MEIFLKNNVLKVCVCQILYIPLQHLTINIMNTLIEKTKKRNTIVNGLENLVHKRFSFEKLNNILSELFNVDEIYAHESEAETAELNGDYDIEFAIDKPIIGGVFDIYYLPMKRKGIDGEEIYITEVGYMFDM